MVLGGSATVLQAVTEVKKTRNWHGDAGGAKIKWVEAEKTEYGRERERETNLDCPVVELSNGECPYVRPVAKKTEYGDKTAGGTEEECLEEEKTDYGRDRKRETSLECPVVKLSNGGCLYTCPAEKKTEYVEKTAGETEAERVASEKTEYRHERKRETSLEHPGMKNRNGGCPYACPSVIIASLRPTGHLESPSPRLAELLEGAEIPGDSGHPADPPEWLDRGLFNEGRRFYKNYLFCLTFSELMSLLLVLGQRHTLKPLIYTGRSDTPGKARRRYLSTLFHLMSWFEGDVWETSSPSRRDLLSIRTTHRRLGESFNQSGEYEKVRSVSVESRGHRQPPDSLLPALKKDLRAAGVKEWSRKKEEEKEEQKEYPVVISHGKEEEKKEKESRNGFVRKEEEDRKKEETQQVYTSQEEEGNRKKEEKQKEEKKYSDSAAQEEKTKKEEDEAKKIYPTPTKEEEEERKRKKKKKEDAQDQEEYPVFISQLDMSLTQYSFMGILLAHPEKLGAGGATLRELEGLVHFWRGLGWLLGIEDRYNFCSGSLEQTRDLCLEVERDVLLPRLSEADWGYELMTSSLISGMSQFLPILSLPAMLRYLGHTLDLPTPALSRSLTWRQFLQYWLMRFTFGAIYYAPGFLRKLNTWFLNVIAKVKEEDKVNLAAYRKAQAALTVPITGNSVRSGVKGGGV